MGREENHANSVDMEMLDSGEEQSEGGQECVMVLSPNGTKYRCPVSNEENTPYMGQQFEIVEQGHMLTWLALTSGTT
nr:protein FAR1-RELATED SEQUENCE 5-like [Ipomoea trifida]